MFNMSCALCGGHVSPYLTTTHTSALLYEGIISLCIRIHTDKTPTPSLFLEELL